MLMCGFQPWQGPISDSGGLVSLSDTLFCLVHMRSVQVLN